MQIKTDITTLSRLYPLFEKAGIEGVLTGNINKIAELTYPELCAALLKGGDLPEICQIITGSEKYIEEGTGETKEWGEISREEALGIVIPFLIGITIGQPALQETPVENPSRETSL